MNYKHVNYYQNIILCDVNNMLYNIFNNINYYLNRLRRRIML